MRNKEKPFEIGDKVEFTRNFRRQIGAITQDYDIQGEVMALDKLPNGKFIVAVLWDGGEKAKLSLAMYLKRVGMAG